MKNETLSGRSGERAQPSSLPAFRSFLQVQWTPRSQGDNEIQENWKVQPQAVSIKHFLPNLLHAPSQPLQWRGNSFNQRQWEVIARQGTLPPARKTVNCLPWWIFGQAVNNLKFTSVSLYLKHKNSFWNKSVHAVFLSKNADFSTGPWLFWNQN